MTKSLLQAENLVKRYYDVTAVDDLSFDVYEGEVFGLLGPNGAGKTTTIRMIMDIIKPDSGSVTVLSKAPGQVRELVGYLPEERGLYAKLKVVDVLVYMGELKGTTRSVARERAMMWLEKMELADRAQAKLRELSRGMQQKVQFIASLVHDPQLLILDEPFQGLDPINVDLIKRQIRELQAAGKTVVLSAHQMNLVEALCDRILLINRSQAILYGRLDEIKSRYAPSTVRLRTSAELGNLPGVVHITERDRSFILTLDDMDPQELLRYLVEQQIQIDLFEVASAPLEEIFIAAVQGEVGV